MLLGLQYSRYFSVRERGISPNRVTMVSMPHSRWSITHITFGGGRILQYAFHCSLRSGVAYYCIRPRLVYMTQISGISTIAVCKYCVQQVWSNTQLCQSLVNACFHSPWSSQRTAVRQCSALIDVRSSPTESCATASGSRSYEACASQ